MNRAEFQRVVREKKPSGFLDFRAYLKSVYDHLKAHYQKFSYIKMSEAIGLGHCNAILLIIQGRRSLTLAKAKDIAVAFGLTGIERQYFVKMVDYQNAKQADQRQALFEELIALKAKATDSEYSAKQLEFFRNWYNVAILEILRFDNSTDDPRWIGQHLKPALSPSKVSQSLELLKELGLVAFDEGLGRLAPVNKIISTGSEVRGLSFMAYHQQMIELAMKALVNEPASQRDMSAVTVSIPHSSQHELKKMIANFRKQVLDFANLQKGADRIVQVNVQMFPLADNVEKDG